jgi:hypothetical protein
MKIVWSKPDEADDGSFDLCGKFNGKYVDVVQRHDSTWSISFNGQRIESGIPTREEAKNKIIQFLQ